MLVDTDLISETLLCGCAVSPHRCTPLTCLLQTTQQRFRIPRTVECPMLKTPVHLGKSAVSWKQVWQSRCSCFQNIPTLRLTVDGGNTKQIGIGQ